MHAATNIVREMATWSFVAGLAIARLRELKWILRQAVPLMHPKSLVSLSAKTGLHDSTDWDVQGKDLMNKIQKIVLELRGDNWRYLKRHYVSSRKLVEWGRHRSQHVMQHIFSKHVPCERVCCCMRPPGRDQSNPRSYRQAGFSLLTSTGCRQ